MLRIIFISLLSIFLLGCVTSPKYMTPKTLSELQQGKRYFEDGYYKRAMRQLLPLACDGVAEAQYAVGYMYYYGYGVAQDTDVGYFWIKRAADKGFVRAQEALDIITVNESKKSLSEKKLRYPSPPSTSENALYY